MRMSVLILAGTGEGRHLAEDLSQDERYRVCVSIAGLTRKPIPTSVKQRVGGFGGADGLADFLKQENVDVLVDATHPFAANISKNAVEASTLAGCPLLRVARKPWEKRPGDIWQPVATLDAAVAKLPREDARVFLSVGRQSLQPFAVKPQHHYLIRVIDPPDVPAQMVKHEIVVGLGPFSVAEDVALFQKHRIDLVVTKNSGGAATQSKIDAARELKIPVVIVDRPVLPDANVGETVCSVSEAIDWLGAHHASLIKRSV